MVRIVPYDNNNWNPTAWWTMWRRTCAIVWRPLSFIIRVRWSYLRESIRSCGLCFSATVYSFIYELFYWLFTWELTFSGNKLRWDTMFIVYLNEVCMCSSRWYGIYSTSFIDQDHAHKCTEKKSSSKGVEIPVGFLKCMCRRTEWWSWGCSI